MDVRELLRQLQATSNVSAIQRATGLNRRTIQRYHAWAASQGLLTGPLPPLEEVQRLLATTMTPPPPPQIVSSVEPYRELHETYRALYPALHPHPSPRPAEAL